MEFEKHLKELEVMTEKMASGQLDLKKSVETFKKGMELIKKCRKEISQSEQIVKKLIQADEDAGAIETEDFHLSEED